MLTRGRAARFNAYAMRLIKLDYLCHHNRGSSRKTLPDLLGRVFYMRKVPITLVLYHECGGIRAGGDHIGGGAGVRDAPAARP